MFGYLDLCVPQPMNWPMVQSSPVFAKPETCSFAFRNMNPFPLVLSGWDSYPAAASSCSNSRREAASQVVKHALRLPVSVAHSSYRDPLSAVRLQKQHR